MLESSPTLGELMLTLATRTGLQKQSSDSRGVGLPTDAGTLSLLRDAINAATAELMRRRTWSWAQVVVVATLDPTGVTSPQLDPASIRLSLQSAVEDYGQVSATFGAYRAGVLRKESPSLLETRHAQTDAKGPPVCFSLAFDRVTGDGDRARPNLMLRVWPMPDKAYKLTFRTKLRHVKLQELPERGWWPEEFDEIVLAGALSHMATLRQTVTEFDPEVMRRFFDKAIADGIVMDSKTATSQTSSMTRNVLSSSSWEDEGL